MAGRIKIDSERCKGCGLCIEACAQQCIVISTQANSTGYFPAESGNVNCTGCAACALMCPDAAITVFRDPIKNISAPDNKKSPAVTRGKS